MHRNDKSKYLLYIEPPASEKLETPVDDEITRTLELALQGAQKGVANYMKEEDMGNGYVWEYNGKKHDIPSFKTGAGFKGFHSTECGERSSNGDYLLENGMITNSLAPFYARWYRNSIHANDMEKLVQLVEFYKNKPTK